MGKFVPEHVDDHWTLQTKERDQPQNRAKRKEPKFFGGPQPLVHCGPGESSEKGLAENGTPGDEENPDDKFHPSGGNHHRIKRRPSARGWYQVGCNFDATHWFVPGISEHWV